MMVNWYRFGDVQPETDAETVKILAVQASSPQWIESGFFDPADGEAFLGERFVLLQPDDMWTYADAILPQIRLSEQHHP